ncbi:hypothetical protein M2272_005803 [Mycobacterium frederiksbergense]|uniref:PE-PPE domain-containing protein n=1 Tax=Mycolicibacterium frederiksbergense TaxID=117567 RepID=A0ABT6L9T4_9MYCO|nr:hypothetical protein [Mycolicibacterium frederiksbergense]MDH6199135.1 hypothetical protein [Mycolicibacterium frederiksbergense]
MAVRPLVTTGAALLSAGALVAATPALFVPRDEIAITASTAAAETPKTLTVEQVNLLALSLQGAWESFAHGYGGYAVPGVVTVPTSGYVVVDGKYVAPGDKTPDTALLYDRVGKALYYKAADGTLVRATVGDMGDGVQFYDAANNKSNENVYAPGDCSATGSVCKDGFVGLAYYFSDNLLPLGDLDNVFWEAGLMPFVQVASSIVPEFIDAFDPTGRLQISKRVDEFFAGGVAMVVGSILNDNLPDGSFAQDLSNSFFFGYGNHTGITAAITYVVDTIVQALNPAPPAADKLVAGDLAEPEADAKLLAKTSGPSSTGLPEAGSLLSLSTTKLESVNGLSKLAAALQAPEPKVSVELDTKGQGTVEQVVDGGTEITPVESEVTKPEVTKPEATKPEVTKPEVTKPEVTEPEAPKPSEITLPQRKIETSTSETGTGTSLVRDSLVATPNSAKSERQKSAGEKFVEKATKDLKAAFAPKGPKASKDKSDAAAQQGNTGDSGSSDSGDK